MAKGCDYSSARPDPACLRGHGIQFVVRYTSIGSAGKNMSAAEVRRLLDAGIALVTVFEEAAGHMLGGRAAGVEAATASRRLAGDCGMPEGRPHYFALDIDPNPLHDSQWDHIRAYLDGAGSVLGRDAVGVYGGFLAIEKLVPHSAPWGWQTRAWSKGKWSAKAHLQQHEIEVGLCGGQVDLDRTHPDRNIDDYGQWGLEDDMPLNDADKKWLQQEIRDAINHHANNLFRLADHGGATATPSPANHPNSHKAILDRLDDIEKRLPSA
ncbi:MAG TPA: glycoside hydrolase domain-containing protein [Actinomycetes bacterium]|jgi:Domain of unknown function (DUF1906)